MNFYDKIKFVILYRLLSTVCLIEKKKKKSFYLPFIITDNQITYI